MEVVNHELHSVRDGVWDPVKSEALIVHCP
jgi:hypothetical protein